MPAASGFFTTPSVKIYDATRVSGTATATTVAALAVAGNLLDAETATGIGGSTPNNISFTLLGENTSRTVAGTSTQEDVSVTCAFDPSDSGTTGARDRDNGTERAIVLEITTGTNNKTYAYTEVTTSGHSLDAATDGQEARITFNYAASSATQYFDAA